MDDPNQWSTILHTVVLKHVTTGELKELPVTEALPPHRIVVRWPMAGDYTIDLPTDKIFATTIRNPIPWRLVNNADGYRVWSEMLPRHLRPRGVLGMSAGGQHPFHKKR